MVKAYDKKERYEKEIKPLVDDIKAKCNLLRIPFIFIAADENDSEDTKYKMSFLSPAGLGVSLKKDLIRNLVNVMNGFATIPPESGIIAAVEESASSRETIRFIDDGSVITGDDGELLLAVEDSGTILEERPRDPVPVIDLSNVVAKEPPKPKKEKSKPKKDIPDDINTLFDESDEEISYAPVGELNISSNHKK